MKANLEKHFQLLHDNPPAPFNPDYKPHAKGCWDRAVALAEVEEGEPTTWTREHRAQRRKEIYEGFMAKLT